MTTKEIRAEYSRLRSIANKRISRLASSGMGHYDYFQRISQLDQNHIRKAYNVVKRFVDNPETTVKGARAALQRQIEEAERRERERASRKEAARVRRSIREKARRKKERDAYNKLTSTEKKYYNTLKKKYGVKLRVEDLQAWIDYVKIRGSQSKNSYADSDRWISEFEELLKTGRELKPGYSTAELLADYKAFQEDQLRIRAIMMESNIEYDKDFVTQLWGRFKRQRTGSNTQTRQQGL